MKKIRDLLFMHNKQKACLRTLLRKTCSEVLTVPTGQRHLSRDERLSNGDRERRRGEGERRGDLDRLLSRDVLRDLERLLQNTGK